MTQKITRRTMLSYLGLGVATVGVAACRGTPTQTFSGSCRVDGLEKLARQKSSTGVFGVSVSTGQTDIGNVATLACDDGKVRDSLVFTGYIGVPIEIGKTYDMKLETPAGLGGYSYLREAKPVKQ